MKEFEIFTYVKGVVLGVITGVIIPVFPFVFLAITITICDMDLAIRAARKRGEEITRKRKMEVFDKIAPYLYSLCLCSLTTYIMKLPFDLSYLACGVIVYKELESIFKHTYTLTGTDLMSYLGNHLKKLLPKK